MEQIIEHDMELDNADTTVQVLEKALTVFQIAKSFLIALVLGIQTKNSSVFLISLISVERNANFMPILFLIFSSATSPAFWVTK